MGLFGWKSNATSTVRTQSRLVSSSQCAEVPSSATVESVAIRYQNFVLRNQQPLDRLLLQVIQNGVNLPHGLDGAFAAAKYEASVIVLSAATAVGELTSSEICRLLPLLRFIFPSLPESERLWLKLDWEARSQYAKVINKSIADFNCNIGGNSLPLFFHLTRSDDPELRQLGAEWTFILKDIGSTVTNDRPFPETRWKSSILWIDLDRATLKN